MCLFVNLYIVLVVAYHPTNTPAQGQLDRQQSRNVIISPPIRFRYYHCVIIVSKVIYIYIYMYVLSQLAIPDLKK